MAVFYSFHYDRDNWRVQQIKQMGVIEEEPILNSQEWEAVRRQSDRAIQTWIDDQMRYKRAVVVLIGAQTASRTWVEYEIRKAWGDRKPLVGIRVHGLEDSNRRADSRGADPFAAIKTESGYPLSTWVPVHDPSGPNGRVVYNSIKQNLTTWVSGAYKP
ncbi:MAG: TIR domain-containing protein [Bifidobacteriaceae bacterium]|jgi:hypothetical protein|nr:TIR domain-containing protein [Bifidobacteriaceae bacterium]